MATVSFVVSTYYPKLRDYLKITCDNNVERCLAAKKKTISVLGCAKFYIEEHEYEREKIDRKDAKNINTDSQLLPAFCLQYRHLH